MSQRRPAYQAAHAEAEQRKADHHGGEVIRVDYCEQPREQDLIRQHTAGQRGHG
jgi:hypothetical protein